MGYCREHTTEEYKKEVYEKGNFVKMKHLAKPDEICKHAGCDEIALYNLEIINPLTADKINVENLTKGDHLHETKR